MCQILLWETIYFEDPSKIIHTFSPKSTYLCWVSLYQIGMCIKCTNNMTNNRIYIFLTKSSSIMWNILCVYVDYQDHSFRSWIIYSYSCVREYLKLSNCTFVCLRMSWINVEHALCVCVLSGLLSQPVMPYHPLWLHAVPECCILVINISDQ